MIDKTKNEQLAMENAAANAGEFIEDIISHGGTSDFATWTPEQFMDFVECVVDGFAYKMVELGTADKPPF